MSRNAVFFAIMCLVWGLTFLPVKIASEHVPPIFLAAVRFWIAGALMLLWAGRDMLKVPTGARWRLLGTALLVNTGNYAFLFWGTAQAPSGLAAVVNLATIPVWSLLASRVIEGHGISGRRVLAIGLGAVGLSFLFATRLSAGAAAAAGNPLEIWGLASVAFGTLLYCLGAVLTRKIAPAMPTLTLAGWQTVIGAAGLTVISLALEPVGLADLRALGTWPVWPALLTLVVGGSLMGFTIYLRLLRDWGAFRAGLYAFVSPVIAVSAGIVVLDEPFGWAEGLGALLMFAAAALALRSR
jgi:drug/metabolite transporter (DMT)-like permease